MIRTEEHAMVRILCDGCKERTMLYLSMEEAVFEMPLIGWRGLGGGRTLCGRPFQHLCETCFETWKKAS